MGSLRSLRRLEKTEPIISEMASDVKHDPIYFDRWVTDIGTTLGAFEFRIDSDTNILFWIEERERRGLLAKFKKRTYCIRAIVGLNGQSYGDTNISLTEDIKDTEGKPIKDLFVLRDIMLNRKQQFRITTANWKPYLNFPTNWRIFELDRRGRIKHLSDKQWLDLTDFLKKI